MTWSCTDPAYRKDGDEMDNDKSNGLSEEERVEPIGNEMDEEFFKSYMDALCKAARAPAENAKLRATIKDLERQRDGRQQAAGAAAERAEKLMERVASLEMEERNLTAEVSRIGGVTRSNMESAGRIASLVTGEHRFLETVDDVEELVREKWRSVQERVRGLEEQSVRRHRCIVEMEAQLAQVQKRFAELEKERDRYRDGFHKASAVAEQLSQAQRPAAPKLSPAMQEWKRIVEDSQKPVTPAQTSRDPRPLELSADGKRMDGDPAAPPPVEVSTLTPNLDKVKTFAPCLDDTEDDGVAMESSEDGVWLFCEDAVEAAHADIRSAVAAERERWEDRIDDYDRRIEADQEHAEFLQNELRMALERGDAALAETQDLRAKLEAAEKLVGQQSDSLQTLGRTINGMAAERRQPVDRDRAIATVMELMAQVRGTGFPSDMDAAMETLDAILGAAKAEPERQDDLLCGNCPEVVKKSFGRQLSTCRIHDEVLHDERTDAEKRCKQCLADGKPSTFTPAPTGEAPSEELVEELAKAGATAYRKARGQEHVRWEDFSEKTRIGERAVARSTYALIAADHSRLAKENAAHVKRVRELEGELGLANRERGEIRQQLDDARAEVERLKAERYPSATKANLEALCRYLNDTKDQEPEHYAGCDVAWLALVALKRARHAASRPRRCPADGMSDAELVDKLQKAWDYACHSLGGYDSGAPIGSPQEYLGAKARELFTPAAPANDERKPKVGDEVWYQGKMRKVLKLGQHEFRVAMGNKNDAHLEDDNVGTWLRHDSCGFTWWRSGPSAKGVG